MIEAILIAGLPGSGKTTLIQRLTEEWGRTNCLGFFTQERREQGRRTGFYWETFGGKRGTLADLEPGQPRVGKYRVNLSSFEEMLGELSSIPAGKILLIDEVGKMECLSERFRSFLPLWEKADCHRLFTVPAYGISFIEAFKSRNRKNLVQLDSRNREQIFQRLRSLVR